MNGTEIRHKGGAEFHIEQAYLADRMPGFKAKANPLLWWVRAKDPAYFGDETFHEITGGTKTKRDAEGAIDDHLREKARPR